MSASAAEVKRCCADAYASEAARWLLGRHLHPGGAALTRRLAEALSVGPQSLVADVACGPGTSSLQLVRETGCRVVGVDLSAESLAAARRAAGEAGLEGRARFLEGDAEALPLEDRSVDGILCECALCTFPDKRAAAAELARVLRPGARLALSDVTAEPRRLPAELRSLEARIACLADARPRAEIAALLERAGLTVEREERHDAALAAMLERVGARLRAARVLGDGLPAALSAGIERGLELAAAARDALEAGALGYAVVIARRD